jgi:hypothetical protein
MARRTRLLCFPRREQQQRRIALNVAFGHGHIENLFHIPPQMIDNRERKPPFAFRSSKILKLIAPKARKLPILERPRPDDMDPVHVVFPRRVLPLPAVVGKVDLLDELAKLPALFGLPLGVLFGHDPD